MCCIVLLIAWETCKHIKINFFIHIYFMTNPKPLKKKIYEQEKKRNLGTRFTKSIKTFEHFDENRIAAKMPRKHINDIERAQTIAWSQEKVSQADIAKRLNGGKRSIGRLIARHKQRPEESIPRRKKGSGRPKKITKGERQKIKKIIEKNPMLTNKEIKTKLKLQISLRSIRRILLEQLELKSYVAAKKPLLTKSKKQKRIKFAKKYLKWTPQMWRKCIFTDESSFETSIVVDTEESDGKREKIDIRKNLPRKQ